LLCCVIEQRIQETSEFQNFRTSTFCFRKMLLAPTSQKFINNCLLLMRL